MKPFIEYYTQENIRDLSELIPGDLVVIADTKNTFGVVELGLVVGNNKLGWNYLTEIWLLRRGKIVEFDSDNTKCCLIAHTEKKYYASTP